MHNLGECLKNTRHERGLSLKDVADKSQDQISKQALSGIEHNRRGLPMKTIYLLSKIYNISFEELALKVLHEQGMKDPLI